MKKHITHIGEVCNEWCQEWRMYDRVLPLGLLVGVLLFLLYFVTISAPLNFPGATYVKVPKDQSFDEIAQNLEERNIIRSALAFRLFARLYGPQTHLMSGEYFFSEPITVVSVARRLMRGDFELLPIKVTLPEGTTAEQMAELLAKKIPDFDHEEFLEKAKPKEGYLFPDTYFFLPGAEPDEVLEVLEENFTRQINDPRVQEALAKFDKPLSDVIIMASLLEKEAAKTKDRQMIAGILWKRIAINMPLQVDAVFPYIIGKNTFNITRAELRTDSPYNTYTNKGLPIGPIANPGLDSILAAMTPVKTNYLFYLSDLNSQFHFSPTYSEHLAKQRKYLP